MRLIDADDRIAFIKNAYCLECDNYNGVRCRPCPINDTIEEIDNAPTVDLWHYPSKGEYPTEDEPVCALVYGFDKPMIVHWHKDDKDELCWQDCWDYCLYNADEVKCWQYIIPPKEEA